MATGTVRLLNSAGGFGTPIEGQKIDFGVVADQRTGKLTASNLKAAG
jgi:cold shock CspA family protein